MGTTKSDATARRVLTEAGLNSLLTEGGETIG